MNKFRETPFNNFDNREFRSVLKRKNSYKRRDMNNFLIHIVNKNI